ncbi:sugar ABC transporter ATP-binding protein [Frigoribacterium sp. PhB24]|uniref:sugar ABC transporter ATP-binding protein n=1 Tax=Frigoribacterium sp. PhB24 TaxID=2485204 RepID=UPI000F470E12|nr:sugar ABC transporter ATP-binding protein [Frigoribacterium sp. PhB24]
MTTRTHTEARRPAFALRGISKTYPGVTALSGVDLEAFPGEVLAICGANGAGKSTMARMIAGQELPSSGTVEIAGHEGDITGPADAEAAGVLMMHQEPLVIDDFTVEENVWLRRISSAGGVRPWDVVRKDRTGRTRSALDAVGLNELAPETPARELGPGPRQMLALSRTQVNEHSVLLLDETTASTTEEHFRDVLDLVDRERASGVCVVFVSHRMDEVFAMADRIAVMRNGVLVDVLRTVETTPGAVIDLMIGEAVAALEPLTVQVDETAVPVLDVVDLAAGSAEGVSFRVAPGEVVGIYGLVGSGRSSVVRSISGHQPRHSGTVRLHGRDVRPTSPRAALRLGVAYLTEDRRREGFVPHFTNGENMTLSTLGRVSYRGVLRRRAERTRVAELIREFQVKGGGDTLTRTLSGGNQQKVIIAKWLEASPEVMILDEPTKGIDVGARSNIYEIVRRLASQGTGVVVVTSEAEEALMLCNRVLIMRDGRLVDEFHPATSTTDDLIRASLGGDTA